MTRKNKKGVKNSNNTPATSGAASTSSQPIAPSSTQPPAKSKETNAKATCNPSSSSNNQSKPANQSTVQKKVPNQSNGLNKPSNDTNSQKGTKKKGKADSKVNTQNSQKNQKDKLGNKKVVPIKTKAPPPKAAEVPVKDEQTLSVPKSTHAPTEFRLKCSLLFKQETAVYDPEVVKMPIVNYHFKITRAEKGQDLEISKSINQMVAQDKINEILTTITSVSYFLIYFISQINKETLIITKKYTLKLA